MPDTPRLRPPSWHTGACLVPKRLPLPLPLCFFLCFAACWPPWGHTGCLMDQLGTLTNSPCLKPGLRPASPITRRKEWAGVRGLSPLGKRFRDLGRDVSRPHSGQTREGCVGVSNGIHSGLTAESTLRGRTWAPFRVPGSCPPFNQQILTEHLLCLGALCGDLVQLSLTRGAPVSWGSKK